MAKNVAHRHTISFVHAFSGIVHTVRTQPNMKVHLIFTFLVITLGFAFSITKVEWIIILFTILWVLISEMINTSIEAMVDLISKEYHQEAKIAKDVAAGMVLLGAFGSVIVGLTIFLPYLTTLFN